MYQPVISSYPPQVSTSLVLIICLYPHQSRMRNLILFPSSPLTWVPFIASPFSPLDSSIYFICSSLCLNWISSSPLFSHRRNSLFAYLLPDNEPFSILLFCLLMFSSTQHFQTHLWFLEKLAKPQESKESRAFTLVIRFVQCDERGNICKKEKTKKCRVLFFWFCS